MALIHAGVLLALAVALTRSQKHRRAIAAVMFVYVVALALLRFA